MTDTKPHIGRDVPRLENLALLRGEGQYTADVPLDEALVLHFLRSPLGGARFDPPDTDAALANPGVHAVHLGADIVGLGRLAVTPVLPMTRSLDFPLLAQGRVQAIGQPVAAVLAKIGRASCRERV